MWLISTGGFTDSVLSLFLEQLFARVSLKPAKAHGGRQAKINNLNINKLYFLLLESEFSELEEFSELRNKVYFKIIKYIPYTYT